MKAPRVAVIQFPGSNCEYETARAATYYGFSSEIVRWNVAQDTLSGFDAYILPGGFSYQDRVRAGAISAKLEIVGFLSHAADHGVPILGICNGCQILAESGLVPDFSQQKRIEMALANNSRRGKTLGFNCDWVYVKIKNPRKSIFTRHFSTTDVLPIQVNHAEGRFVLSQPAKDQVSQLTAMVYCDAAGNEGAFPITPNGSEGNFAGLCNTKGNVLAMMPHPERAAVLKQIPFWISGPWSKQKHTAFQAKNDAAGPWDKLFVAMREAAESRR